VTPRNHPDRVMRAPGARGDDGGMARRRHGRIGRRVHAGAVRVIAAVWLARLLRRLARAARA
jgi:hypothetical protein